MKKLFALAASLILVVVAANAQSEKKEPPPPPPPMEEAKPKPPKIIKEEKIKQPPVITVQGKLADEFYARNPSVSDISRQGNIITLKTKDGTIEKYDLSKKDEDKSFTEKYGRSPISPPPPPPKVEKTKLKPFPQKPKEEKIKPPPPKIIIEERIQEPPVITVKGKMADEFYQRNPTVSEISRRENVITLKMKDGKTEQYDMSKKDEDKSFTDKYGRSPIPPPPPPTKFIYKKTST